MNKKLFLLANGCIAFIFSTAQNVGLGTASPQALLHVADSNVLFTGPNPFSNYAPAASPPAQGPGTRLMWYPQKAAFRAGWVEDDRWNKDSIGIFSIAMGHSALASYTSSVAIGFRTRSTGFGSTALGFVTEALSDGATSLGHLTKAVGLHATSMGSNTMAAGFASTSMGNSTMAMGSGSTSMGLFTNASSSYSLAIGQYNDISATNRLFEIGNGTSENNRANAFTVLQNGNTGIGVLNPLEKLEVAGKIKSTAIQITSGAAEGRVLVSDAAGNAGWQAGNINTGIEASASSTQTIFNNQLTTVLFNNEHTDPAGAYNPGTSAWTIPSAGFYHISSAVLFFTPLPVNTDVTITLNVNGLVTKRKAVKLTGQSSVDISAEVQLAANDVVDVFIIQQSGAPVTLFTGRDNTYISGFKVY